MRCAPALGGCVIIGSCLTSFGAPVLGQDQPPGRAVAAAMCGIAIAAVVDEASGDRLAILASARGPGVATGNLWVNTSSGPYRVSFEHRGVLSAAFSGDVDPIAFHLPPSAALENAFVSDLNAPPSGPAPCEIFEPRTSVRGSRLRAALTDRIAESPPVRVARAIRIRDAAVACSSPDLSARIISQAVPDPPPIAQQQGITGSVRVLVQLATTSRISATSVVWARSSLLVAAALDAANRSRYQTAIIGCTPRSSNILIDVRFAGP